MIKHGFQKVPFRGYQAGAEEVLCHFSKSGSYHVLCCYLKTLLEAWSDHCSLPSAVLSAQTNGRVSSFGLEFYKRTAKLPKASRVVVGGLSEGRPKGADEPEGQSLVGQLSSLPHAKMLPWGNLKFSYNSHESRGQSSQVRGYHLSS